MTVRQVPRDTDTVIVGNGPSALILSYILHGYIPYYNPSTPHPDPFIHRKLSLSPCLLDLDVDGLTAHFGNSRFSYSAQALPVNILLDTLLRPLADTDPGEFKSCVEWRFEEKRQRDHVVIGDTVRPGGQWADNPVSASWDIRALSYVEQLDLPGYSIAEHYAATHDGLAMPDFYRPTRREFAGYLAAYPDQVGIADSVFTRERLSGISRVEGGFYVSSHGIRCRHLVLATGTFSNLIPPRPLLRPLKSLPNKSTANHAALLVIGSGFTAADIILSADPNRKLLHVYKWDPEHAPSPLKACHPAAYPEYASVYRRMKTSARSVLGANVVSPYMAKRSNPFFQSGQYESNYEGFPNTLIEAVNVHGDIATIRLRGGDGRKIEREVSGLECVIGRCGSLTYLDQQLRDEFLKPQARPDSVSGRTLRRRIEESFEVAPNVFVIGGLTGDSLIKFAYGGCVQVAASVSRPEAKTAVPHDHINGSDLTMEKTHIGTDLTSTLKSLLSELGNAKRRDSGCELASSKMAPL